MLHIGIDVPQKSSVFNVFDPNEGGEGGKHRSQKVETTAEPHPLVVSLRPRRRRLRTNGTSPGIAAGPLTDRQRSAHRARPTRMGRPRIALCARLLVVG